MRKLHKCVSRSHAFSFTRCRAQTARPTVYLRHVSFVRRYNLRFQKFWEQLSKYQVRYKQLSKSWPRSRPGQGHRSLCLKVLSALRTGLITKHVKYHVHTCSQFCCSAFQLNPGKKKKNKKKKKNGSEPNRRTTVQSTVFSNKSAIVISMTTKVENTVGHTSLSSHS